MIVIQKPVKNYSSRDGLAISGITLHIADGLRNSVYQTFLNPANKKSSHYLVNSDGSVWQFVEEKFCAWHAGYVIRPRAQLLKWFPNKNPNKYLIGIEHEGFGNKDITEAQYQATAGLIKEISQRYHIPLDDRHIIPHNSINASKSCPGRVSVARVIALASEKTPEVINDPSKQVASLQRQIGLLRQLLELFRKLDILLKRSVLGSMNTKMNYSLTQAGNLSVFVGLIFIVLQKLDVNIARDEVEMLLTGLFTVGGLIASWIGRYRKGDLTMGGFRKSVTIGEKGDLN